MQLSSTSVIFHRLHGPLDQDIYVAFVLLIRVIASLHDNDRFEHSQGKRELNGMFYLTTTSFTSSALFLLELLEFFNLDFSESVGALLFKSVRIPALTSFSHRVCATGLVILKSG
jgi:hypothetical protein